MQYYLKKWLSILTITLLAISANYNAFSQNKGDVLLIDDSLHIYPANFPFDRPFKIDYKPAKKSTINYVGIYEVGPDGCVKNFVPFACFKEQKIDSLIRDNQIPKDSIRKYRKQWIKNYKRDWKKDYDTSAISETLHFNPYDTTKSGIQFDIPALKPNKNYLLTFYGNNNTDILSEILDLLGKNDTAAARVSFEESYRKYKLETKSYGKIGCGCDIILNFATYDGFLIFYNNKLKNINDSIFADKGRLDSLTGTTPTLQIIKFDDDKLKEKTLEKLLNHSKECISCKDSLPISNWLLNDKFDLQTILLGLSQLNQNKDVSYGFVNVFTQTLVVDRKISFSQRIENLTISYKNITGLKRVAEYFKINQVLSSNEYDDFTIVLDSINSSISSNIQSLNTLSSQEKALRKRISESNSHLNKVIAASDELYGPVGIASPTTFTYNFETRNSYIIRADFGFLYYQNFNSNSSFKGVAPYLGFHINFRPIDTNIPFGTIRHEGVLGHLSFNGGALIGSFEEENVRDGLIGNTAIFTGLGWGFTDWLRLTSGAVLYRKVDPSPLKTKKTTAAVPFLGVSIDIRLQDIFKAFVNVFPK